MQNLFKKFGAKFIWAIVASAIAAKFKDDLTPHQEQGLNTLKEIGDDTVQALTDNNPDDKTQLLAVYEAHKDELIEIALNLIEDEIKDKFADQPQRLAKAEFAIKTLRELCQLHAEEKKPVVTILKNTVLA